jgi:hypothetical protein
MGVLSFRNRWGVRQSRLAVRRKTGYMSARSLRDFYGSWRASLHFNVPRGEPAAVPCFWAFNRWFEVPPLIMHTVFRPFNTYRATARGERFC